LDQAALNALTASHEEHEGTKTTKKDQV